MENIENLYELVPLQHGILFYTLLSEDPGSYLEQFQCCIEGELDLARFFNAWQEAEKKFDVLRTSVHWKELSKPLQAVHCSVKTEMHYQDWREFGPHEQEKRLKEFLDKDRKRGFDITQAPLHRLALFRISDRVHELVWTRHHLIIDRWSRSVVLRWVWSTYDTLQRNCGLEHTSHPPFSAYVQWLQQRDRREAEVYWRRVLDGVDAPTNLWPDQQKSHSGYLVGKVSSWNAVIDKDDSEWVRSWVRTNRITVNTLVTATWGLLLGWYSGTEDVVFGTTVSTRPPEIPDVHKMVGLMINTLPVRVKIGSEINREWLSNLHRELAVMRGYDYVSLADIRAWTNVPNDIPLFESLLVVENLAADLEQVGKETSLDCTNVRGVSSGGNVPLTLVVNPERCLEMTALYDSERYEDGLVKQLLDDFVFLLLQFVKKSPDSWSGCVERVFPTWMECNLAHERYPRDESVNSIFEEQVRTASERTAIVDAAGTLNYDELDKQAAGLSRKLQQTGIGKGDIVGVCVSRSRAYPVALLSILKVGAVYLPLSSADPAQRVRFMLSDSAAHCIVCDTSSEAAIREIAPDLQHINVDNVEPTRVAGCGRAVGIHAEDLAYLMYTSGSTGDPKAVAVTHRGIVRLVCGTDYAEFGPNQVFAQIAPITFDACTFELWGALLNGGKCVIYPDEIPDSSSLRAFIVNHRISTMWLTSSLFNVMVDEDVTMFRPLQQLLVGGEALSVPHIRRVRQELPELRLVNGYGPTECTTFSCCYEIPSNIEPGVSRIPIGKPIANSSAYILDERGRRRPVGTAGELYIGGDGVARGYWRRSDLTAERFLKDPFSRYANARMYRTGDKARWLSDGNIEYLGRFDDQLKIRGYRIEPGEIEHVLRKVSRVRNAHVQCVETNEGNGKLIAFVEEGTPTGVLKEKEMKITLEKLLPRYMIPERILVLDEFPLTGSGKIDRHAIASLVGSRDDGRDPPKMPSDEVEEQLVEIWKNVLGLTSFGVNESFFELGGHSLLSIQLIAEVGRQFKQDVPLTDFFENPTIEHLACLIKRTSQSGRVLVPIQVDGKKAPFFFVPGGAGDEILLTDKYSRLGTYFGKERPLYGLALSGLVDSNYDSVEQLASALIEEMKRVHPNGPYLIGGACIGGVVAYEIGRQLTAQGCTVNLVFMLDTHCPSQKVEKHFKRLRMSRTVKRTKRTLRHVLWRVHVTIGQSFKVSMRSIPGYLADKYEYGVKFIHDMNDYYRKVEHQVTLAHFCYRPQPYDARICLVVPEENSRTDVALGWDSVGLNNLQVIKVAGGHGEYIGKYIDETGQILMDAIASSEKDKGWQYVNGLGGEIETGADVGNGIKQSERTGCQRVECN